MSDFILFPNFSGLQHAHIRHMLGPIDPIAYLQATAALDIHQIIKQQTAATKAVQNNNKNKVGRFHMQHMLTIF